MESALTPPAGFPVLTKPMSMEQKTLFDKHIAAYKKIQEGTELTAEELAEIQRPSTHGIWTPPRKLPPGPSIDELKREQLVLR